MKLTINLIRSITGSSLLLATPSVAANLSLTPWEILGDVQIVNANLVYLSNNALVSDDFGFGLDENYNFSNNPAVDNFFSDLETGLGLLSGALDLDANKFEYAYEGSALKKIVKVQAGEQLSFKWNFLTNELSQLKHSFPDYGFLLVDDQLIKLASVNNELVASSKYEWETGWQTYNYTFTSDSESLIAFGVVDIGDYAVSSAFKISNVNLSRNDSVRNKIPEPNLRLGLFCWGVWALSRFRHRTQKSKKN